MPSWADGEVVDLQHYYRCLGVLSRCMPRIEEDLFFWGKDLFTPSPDLLFFDTTAANATFALNPVEWFRLGRLFVISLLLSGDSPPRLEQFITYPGVQNSPASSL